MNFDRYTLSFIIRSGRRLKVARGIGRDAQDSQKQGITGIILTPHLRHGMFKHPLEKIERHYKKLMPYANKLGIELKLGTEYHVATDMIDAFHGGLCHTLADTQYILTEYSHSSEYSFVYKMTREAIFAGYIPVIAHVERYECLRDISRIEDLQELGALIQVNADSVLGIDGRHFKRYTKKLLKAGLVDVIASDSHGTKERVCNMKNAMSTWQRSSVMTTRRKSCRPHRKI